MLVDPWLTGTLTFGNNPDFFEGTKKWEIPLKVEQVTQKRFGCILLSQGLPDHCHEPTLEKIDKSVKIVGNSQAIEVCRKLGFTDTEVIEHGQSV